MATRRGSAKQPDKFTWQKGDVQIFGSIEEARAAMKKQNAASKSKATSKSKPTSKKK